MNEHVSENLRVVPDEVGDVTPDDALPPGTQLSHGQYTLTRLIGSGGFGITYLATDRLGRDLIVKECFIDAICRRNRKLVTTRTRDNGANMQKLLRYFVEEARNLSRLSHPNIVGVRDVFEDNDTAYMTMDYLRGRDLLDIIEVGDRKLEPSEIMAITQKLLRALEYVHDFGLLHCDVSPDNILVKTDCEPMLIDFGAVRKTGMDASKKYSGLTIVKDGYSPHELYTPDGNVGPWSDLYGLAASMYHAITGAVPTASQNRLAAVAGGTPDPCQKLKNMVESYPPVFLECLDKAMNVIPATRFQSAKEWLGYLEGNPTNEDPDMKLLGKTIRIGGANHPSKPMTAPTAASISDDTKPTKPQPPKPQLAKPESAKPQPIGKKMAIDLSGLKNIGGFIAGCLVDTDGGLVMASEVVGKFDIDTAAAANVEVVRAKLNAMALLGLDDIIEDILITLGTQLHLIRPLEKAPTLFIYAALDRKTANLGLARAQVKKVEQAIKI